MVPDFYTYLWLREDGTPYYVGKGCGNRAWRKGCPSEDRVLVQNFPSETDAFYAEQFLVAYYGRKDLDTGCLINHSDGGEGAAGAIRTEAFRKRVGEFWKGRTFSEEQRAQFRITSTGQIMSASSRHKMSLAKTGKKLGPRPLEVTAKIVAKLKGQRRSTEQVQRIREGCMNSPAWVAMNVRTRYTKGHECSEETKMKMSIAAIGNTNACRKSL
jgi:hypothetical protein